MTNDTQVREFMDKVKKMEKWELKDFGGDIKEIPLVQPEKTYLAH